MVFWSPADNLMTNIVQFLKIKIPDDIYLFIHLDHSKQSSNPISEKSDRIRTLKGPNILFMDETYHEGNQCFC